MKCQDQYNADTYESGKLGDEHCESKRAAVEIWQRALACFDTVGVQPKNKESWLEEKRKSLEECERDVAQSDAIMAKEKKEAADRDAARQARKADAEREATEKEAALKDPAFQHSVAAASICFFAKLRSKILTEIAKQKKYAALGGVFDKQQMLMLQQMVMRCDDGTARARKLLGKSRAAACTERDNAQRVACFIDSFEGSTTEKNCATQFETATGLIPELDPPD